jgi:hypothetical protein
MMFECSARPIAVEDNSIPFSVRLRQKADSQLDAQQKIDRMLDRDRSAK